MSGQAVVGGPRNEECRDVQVFVSRSLSFDPQAAVIAVYLVYLVCLVYLVYFVISFIGPNEPDRPNKPDRPERLEKDTRETRSRGAPGSEGIGRGIRIKRIGAQIGEYPHFPVNNETCPCARTLDKRGNANVITPHEEQVLKEEAMKARVVRIGNSRGIRIPKAVIEQCHLHGAVDLEIQQGQLVIRSAVKPRAGWDQAFVQMHQQGDDQLLDRESTSTSKWDRKDWTW